MKCICSNLAIHNRSEETLSGGADLFPWGVEEETHCENLEKSWSVLHGPEKWHMRSSLQVSFSLTSFSFAKPELCIDPACDLLLPAPVPGPSLPGCADRRQPLFPYSEAANCQAPGQQTPQASFQFWWGLAKKMNKGCIFRDREHEDVENLGEPAAHANSVEKILQLCRQRLGREVSVSGRVLASPR